MQQAIELARQGIEDKLFDACAVAVVDFKQAKSQCFEIYQNEIWRDQSSLYFDLASLTKPLSLGYYHLLHPENFDSDLTLLLNHAAGLPSWGRLSKDDWKAQILSYEIVESEQVYSDFSSIRLWLELEKRFNIDLLEEMRPHWHPEIVYWKQLPEQAQAIPTGERCGQLIQGVVHDDNALTINRFSAHSGLFGTAHALAQTLLKMEQETQVSKYMRQALQESAIETRFVRGWDRVQDLKQTLAGQKVSLETFGHLGFTGTSFWIDTTKQLAVVLLSNASRYTWGDRIAFNQFRRQINTLLFSL